MPVAHPPPAALASGTLYALAAGLMWGLVFAAPLLLPDYPAALLAFGRYLVFGLLALGLAVLDLPRLRELSGGDWIEAVRLALVGNVVYYLCLASAIQLAGGPLPTVIIGTLPVVIAVVSNRRDAARDGRLPWRSLVPSLAVIAAGVALVHRAEFDRLAGRAGGDPAAFALGALLAVLAVACWAWYALRNADWLRAHPGRSPRAWATAQGLATLPLALVGYAGIWAWDTARGGDFPMPLGPDPALFLAVVAALALFASWLGTLCWNAASQRLPTRLVGQLIVFETLAALAYAFALRGEPPSAPAAAGIALLVAGVLLAVRPRPAPAGAVGT